MEIENFTGLYAYLHGDGELEKKLKVGYNAFLASSKVPPQQKEDVVIYWLVQTIISAQDQKLDCQQQINAWTIAAKIIKSQRLSTLCKNQWLCPISSEFIQTMHQILMNKSTDDSIISSILEICQNIITLSNLSSRIVNQTSFWFYLTKFMVDWVIKGHQTDSDLKFCIRLVEGSELVLKNHPDHSKQANIVLNDYLMQYITLTTLLDEQSSDSMKLLVNHMSELVLSTLFHRTLNNIYKQNFKLIFDGEDNLSPIIQRLLSMITKCLEENSIETSSALVTELLLGCMTKYKHDSVLQYQFVVVIIHLLGVQVPFQNDKHIHLTNNIATNLKGVKQEYVLLSILTTIKSSAIEMNTEINKVTFQAWLKNLALSLINFVPESPKGYKCFQLLLQISPSCFMNNMDKLFSLIILQQKSNDEIYEAYDDLMCDILNIYIKMRRFPRYFSDLISALKLNRSALLESKVIPSSFLHCEKILFPPKMMKLFNKEVYILPQRSLLKLWTSLIHYVIVEADQLTRNKEEKDKKLLSTIIWIVTCCVGSSAFLNIVAIEGLPTKIAELMSTMGHKGIQPLIKDVLLAIPHNNDLCVSILLLCHAWGELHIILSNTDTGYLDYKDLPQLTCPSSDHPTDFSYLMPFINTDTWALLSARIINFGNRASRFAMLQLAIQKLAASRLMAVQSDTDSTELVKSQSKIMSQFLLSSIDAKGYDVIELLVHHLPVICPFIHEEYLPILARCLHEGYLKQDKVTMKYLKSHHFREAARLHPYILSSLCQSIQVHLNVNTKKRKSPESDGEINTFQSTSLKIFRKLWKTCPLISNKENLKNEDSELWEEINECGQLLALILDSDANNTNVSFNEEELLLLKILEYLPLSNLERASQAVVLLINLTMLVKGLSCSNNAITSQVLNCINIVMTSSCHCKLFDIINMKEQHNIMGWILKQRYMLPHDDAVNCSLISKKNIDINDTSVTNKFDLVFENFAFKYLLGDSVGEKTRELGKFICNTGDDVSDSTVCHVAAIYVSVCRKFLRRKNNLGKSCRSIIRHIGTWMLRYFRTLTTMVNILDSTSADILFIYTVLLEVYEYNHEVKQNSPQDIDMTILEEAAQSDDQEKSHKWQKLIPEAVKLSENALNAPKLTVFALQFLITAAKNKDILEKHLPSGLLNIVRDKLLLTYTEEFELDMSLGPLLSNSTTDEYEGLLLYMIRRVQADEDVHLKQTMSFWQTIITGQVYGVHGRLKKEALDYLIAILSDKLKCLADHEQETHILCYLNTINTALECDIHLSQEVCAMALSACMDIDIVKLSPSSFITVYKSLCSIVNSLVVKHSQVVAKRVTLIMAAIEKLAEIIGSKGSNDNETLSTHIYSYVECFKDLERIVKELKNYKEHVNKVCHFSVVKIIETMEKISVYPLLRNALNNIIYLLLDLCDPFAIQHLHVVLPSSTTTILKQHLEYFKRYIRFKPH